MIKKSRKTEKVKSTRTHKVKHIKVKQEVTKKNSAYSIQVVHVSPVEVVDAHHCGVHTQQYRLVFCIYY